MLLQSLFADKTSSSDALFSLVNILNAKPITGFDNAGASDLGSSASTNLMDIIGAVKALPLGSDLLGLVHAVVPGPVLVEEAKSILVNSEIGSNVLGLLGDTVTEETFGGDALGAVVGHLKSIPVLEPIVTQVIDVAHSLPVVGPIVGTVTGLLHDISLGGHLLTNDVPAGTDLSSEQFDDRSGLDTLDVVVNFAKSLPVVGDVVQAVIPEIFPKALGENGVAIANILHNVIPGFEIVNSLIGEEGVVTDLLGLSSVGDNALVGNVLGGTDLLGGLLGEDGLVGGLLGGNGLLGGLGGGTDLLGGLLGDEGLVGGLLDTLIGENGILGGLTGGLLGGNDLLGGLTGGTGLVDTLLGDNGLVGGLTGVLGGDNLLGGLLGDDGLVGGLLGDDGLVGGLLGGLLGSSANSIVDTAGNTTVGGLLGDSGLVGGLLGGNGLVGGLLGSLTGSSTDGLLG